MTDLANHLVPVAAPLPKAGGSCVTLEEAARAALYRAQVQTIKNVGNDMHGVFDFYDSSPAHERSRRLPKDTPGSSQATPASSAGASS